MVKRKFEKIPISEAKSMKKIVEREAKVLEEFKQYIKSLTPNDAGKFEVKDNKDGFAVRANIIRAAKSLGLNVKVKKSGKVITFWVVR